MQGMEDRPCSDLTPPKVESECHLHVADRMGESPGDLFSCAFWSFQGGAFYCTLSGLYGRHEESQGNHGRVPQVLRPWRSPPSLFHISKFSYACLLCYAHVFSKKEGPGRMGRLYLCQKQKLHLILLQQL